MNRRSGWLLAVVGLAAFSGAAIAAPRSWRLAVAQDWSPFVLVSGLLLIGLVADDDGLFSAAGHLLARWADNGVVLFVGAACLIGVVTAVLNLDTSVVFLAPVLVYTARARGSGEAPLLYGCLMLSNAGSLFLPGSNLTNLIVLGRLHLSGGDFFSRMWPAALGALVVTAAVVGVLERSALGAAVAQTTPGARARKGTGLVSLLAAGVLVIVLRSPALPVLGVGLLAVGIRSLRGGLALRRTADALGLPVLAGLFGVAAALGTLGRSWSQPASVLSHADGWLTAAVAALCTVLVNNLPAASLLSARGVGHPFALLVGLDLGPNLFASGSLAWVLWIQSARNAGARPSIATASKLGMVAVPLSMAVALGALRLTGSL